MLAAMYNVHFSMLNSCYAHLFVNISHCHIIVLCVYRVDTVKLHTSQYKKGQLSLTNPYDACEKFARFT